jgi:hypothetical protein
MQLHLKKEAELVVMYGCEAKAKTQKDRGNVTRKHYGEIYGLGNEQGV